ncbi:MAG: EF-hand domain-containing protein [Pseudomonadota bacterium]
MRFFPFAPRWVRSLVLTALAGVPAGAAWAQMVAEPPAPSPEQQATASRGERQAAMQFKMLDADGDGFLSRDEVALFPRLRDAFDKADADHDGKVSFAEIRAVALQRQAERAQAAQAPAPGASSAPGTPGVPDSGAVAPVAPPASPPPAEPPAVNSPAPAEPLVTRPPAAIPPAASPPATNPPKKWWWPF